MTKKVRGTELTINTEKKSFIYVEGVRGLNTHMKQRYFQCLLYVISVNLEPIIFFAKLRKI